MNTVNQRKSALENKLSNICGIKIEITVRSLTSFTISADGQAINALEKAKSFLSLAGALSDWINQYDQECDYTFAYFNLNA